MDLIQRAAEKREWHLAQAARLEAFLATAYDLEQDLKAAPTPVEAKSDAEKASLPKRASTRPTHGIGADTIRAAEDAVRERGPISTRDLLPLILAKGIEVGGKSPVATLSARLSNRSDLVMHHGKWQFKQALALTGAGDEEATDIPTKDTSAASLFTQTKENDDAAALVS